MHHKLTCCSIARPESDYLKLLERVLFCKYVDINKKAKNKHITM